MSLKLERIWNFTVYNLFPDYVYPGKLETIEITAKGAEDQDKQVTVTLMLSKQNENSDFDQANVAFARIESEIGTFKDVYFNPIDEEGNNLYSRGSSHRLRAEFTIDKTAKAGYWTPKQISVTDAAGLARYEGINQFGWKLFINNAREDTIPPEYIANSLRLTLVDPVDCSDLDQTIVRRQKCLPDEPVSILRATWDVNENQENHENLKHCYAAFVRQRGNERIDASLYSYQVYGKYTKYSTVSDNGATGQCVVNLLVTSYFPHGNFTVSRIAMQDLALNEKDIDFNRDDRHEHPHAPVSITFPTRPDEVRPILLSDVGDIEITAMPTNPEAPNGETVVTIEYTVYDPPSQGNKTGSGYNFMRVYLRDPQGTRHYYADTEHPNYFTLFFKGGDPGVQKRYTMRFTLPEGSAPGRWGIIEINLFDKAGNASEYDFTEQVRFSVQGEE